MITYIALLRGINVSGKNKIKMAELVQALELIGLSNIQTYIQSGNVVFKSQDADKNQLKNLIEAQIKTTFRLDVPVLIRDAQEWEQVIQNKPGFNSLNEIQDKIYVTFLSDVPETTLVEALQKGNYKEDLFIQLNREVYLYCLGGYGETKLSNSFLEKKLKCTSTTRNWRTIIELMSMAKSIETFY
jgi:uncharacterized protein (DUF1697 family)